MKKTLIILLTLILWENQCYANPTIPNPFIAIPALALEAIIVAICVIPFRLDWLRFLYCWPLATFITWLFSTFMFMVASDIENVALGLNVSQSSINTKVIIIELIVVLIEALILNIMSKNKYFHLAGAKPLGWARSIIISFIANVASYYAGIYFLTMFYSL